MAMMERTSSAQPYFLGLNLSDLPDLSSDVSAARIALASIGSVAAYYQFQFQRGKLRQLTKFGHLPPYFGELALAVHSTKSI